MGYKVNFTENQSISAEDLNAIAADFSDEGTSFSDGKLYGVSDLNAISKAIITKGVSDGCDVKLKTSTTVFISQGTAFFGDGKKMEIDSSGITLTRASKSKKNYVWLSNDDVTGNVCAKCTTTAPAGDCVKLAEISTGGTVTKTKDLALMKNSSFLPNLYREPITFTLNPSSGKEYLKKEIDIGEDFKRMVAMSKSDMVYLDWESMLGHRTNNDDRIEAYDLTKTPSTFAALTDVAHLKSENGCRIWFVSYKNNKLTVETRGSGLSEFTIYCM